MRYKFRAYDESNEVMEYGVSVDNGRPVKECYQLYNTGNTVYHSQLMQFTGLTDKNGVEIYEGDILRLLYSEVLCEVIYDAPSFRRRWISPKVSSLRGVELESMAHNTHIEYEVIGNIHQHKHLLKENEK